MAMTKILGFTGEAEILGGLHGVVFHAGGLTINGLDLDGAYAVMEALSKKALTGVRLVPGDRPADPRVEEYKVAQATGFAGSFSDFLDYIHDHTAGKLKTVKAEPEKPRLDAPAFAGESATDRAARGAQNAANERAKEEKKPKPALTTVEKEAIKSLESGSTTTKLPEGATLVSLAEKAAEVKTAEKGASSDIPEKVASSKRFIEVLEWVMKENNLAPKDVDAIIAKLEMLKDRIPVVQRVRDLRDKVTSNLAAWAENGG
jgi:hypothetical protein